MTSDRDQATVAPRAARLHTGSFHDALAVVTGAGSGIGRATAAELAALGARVALVDRNPDAAAAVAADIVNGGGDATVHACDVSDPNAMATAADRIIANSGPVDILINNAGVGMSARFADMSLDDWEWIRSINLDGVLNGCRAFGVPMLRSGSGHIVNVSSGLAYSVRASEPAYVTTKAAVLAFSRCLRSDWGPQGIGVSVICPGVINTPIFANTRLLGHQDSDRFRSRGSALFARGHSPTKVARAVTKAIARDQGLVPVGWEARLGWFTNRLLPAALQDQMGRIELG